MNICYLFLAKQCSKKPEETSDKRHILLLFNLEERYSDAILFLSHILDSYEDVSCTANWREKEHIGQEGIPNWARKKIKEAEVVVFFRTHPLELSTEKNLDTEVSKDVKEEPIMSVVFRIAEQAITSDCCPSQKHKFLLVDFEDLNVCSKTCFCKHYKLTPKNVKPLFKHMLGKKYKGMDERSRIILESKLQLAKVNYTKTMIYSEELRTECSSSLLEDTCLNKLDDTSLVNNMTQQNSLNIPMGNLPSIESNVSQPYETTDFNDERRLQRYQISGARPKEPC